MFRTTTLRALLCPLMVAFAFGVVFAAQPASAADGDWRLMFGLASVDPDVSLSGEDSDGGRLVVDASSATGFCFALERRLSSRIGLEIGGQSADPDLRLNADLGDSLFTATGSVRYTSLAVGLNVHLTPDRAVDLYVGPLAAYVFFGDLGLTGDSVSLDFRGDDDVALGAQIGADISFGESSWSLRLLASYLDATLTVTDEVGETSDLGFDPLTFGVGFGYRF